MQTYLVGGAVRDKLLGYPVIEKDWVVVGSNEKLMLADGFKRVGKDFPVFLHPQTKEEYALARTERKSGKGYYGFEINANESVTLEEDLVRRDLTINAMAMDKTGQLYDPYDGQSDIKSKQLRHISPAFAEDPLRVLRVARFAARYHHLGFTIAEETIALMSSLSKSGELDTLVAERVWRETERALTERSPEIYFLTLQVCGALKALFPEVDRLWGIPNPEKWHPEIDTGVHTMMVLQQCAKLTKNSVTRFAALCHDLGKGITPKHLWPSHKGHEKTGVAIIEQLCERLKVPNEYRKLAKLVSEFHLHLHRIEELTPKTIVKLLEHTNAFKENRLFEQYIIACEADFRGRTGFEDREYPQAEIMKKALIACQEIPIEDIIQKGYSGKKIGDEIHRQRVSVIKHLR